MFKTIVIIEQTPTKVSYYFSPLIIIKHHIKTIQAMWDIK